MIEYKAAYYHDRDSGWYTASVLDFPGVLSQGKTLDNARRMLGDALREMTEWLLEDGQPLPRPDPTANDVAATVIEPIELVIRARSRMVGP
jgi:predicted RNase H-like HicB family nuclease